MVNSSRVTSIKNFREEMELLGEISQKLHFCGNFSASETDIKKRSLPYFPPNHNFKN